MSDPGPGQRVKTMLEGLRALPPRTGVSQRGRGTEPVTPPHTVVTTSLPDGAVRCGPGRQARAGRRGSDGLSVAVGTPVK